MKTFISALGLVCLASAAQDPIKGTFLEPAFEELNLTQEPEEFNLESPTKDYPKVKAFGWDSSKDLSGTPLYSTDGNWGMDVGVNIDTGLYYELPVYNQNNYLVFRQRIGAYAGGRQYVSFLLGNIFRLTFFLDLWITKVTFFDNYLRVDIVNYNDFCDAMQYLIDVLRFQLLFQLDVNECLWGLVGSLTNSTQDCEWSTYYTNHPILDWNPSYEGLQGYMFPNKCGDVPRYDG